MSDRRTTYQILVGVLVLVLLVVIVCTVLESPKPGPGSGGSGTSELSSDNTSPQPAISAIPSRRSEAADRKFDGSLFPNVSLERRVGEFGLLNPTWQDFDAALRDWCLRYARLEAASERTQFRSAIPSDKLHSLRSFAMRAAVFAMRDSDPETLRAGMAALAMIDTRRSDYRDILVAIAVLHHATVRIGLDPALTFDSAAMLAGEGTAGLLRQSYVRDDESTVLEKSWGYREVELESGIGLASFGAKPYEPEHDLLALGLGLAGVFEDDDFYQARSLQIGSDLPSIWLGGRDRTDADRVESILAEANAGMTVRADPVDWKLRANHRFTMFTVEVESPAAASELLEISNRTRLRGTATLGFAQENVFSLIVAKSSVKGESPIETNESLQRFAESIGNTLAELAEP